MMFSIKVLCNPLNTPLMKFYTELYYPLRKNSHLGWGHILHVFLPLLLSVLPRGQNFFFFFSSLDNISAPDEKILYGPLIIKCLNFDNKKLWPFFSTFLNYKYCQKCTYSIHFVKVHLCCTFDSIKEKKMKPLKKNFFIIYISFRDRREWKPFQCKKEYFLSHLKIVDKISS